MTVTALLGLGALGAGLHVLGSVLIVFGQASVKVSHAIVDSTGAPSTWAVPRSAPHPPLWRRPDGKWRRQKAGSKAYAFGGWSAFAVGNIIRFIAMRFAAQTVLSGLGSLQFVIIPIASRYMLGIRTNTSTVVGVTTVLLGNMLIILYGPAEVTFTLQELRHQWATPAMTTFLVVLGGLLCALQWLYWRITGGGMQAQPHLQLAATLDGSSRGTAGSSGGSGGAGLAADSQYLSAKAAAEGGSSKYGGGGGGLAGGSGGSSEALPREQDAVLVFTGALLFSAVASFVGAWSVLFSKSMTYVVSYLPESLGDWYSWFILVAFLGTAAFWVRQSDRGLRYYPASLIMPLMQAFWMCMSVLEGGIYFDELTGLPSRHLALLVLGLILALLGAIFMGIAGFIAEKPEHIFHYRAAATELAAHDSSSTGAPSQPTSSTVKVLVETMHATVGRLSSPVLRAVTGNKPGYCFASSGSGGAEQEAGMGWWQQDVGGVTQVHVVAAPASGLTIELPPRSSSLNPSAGDSPQSLLRLQAVRSPTQQLLSRENSGRLDMHRSGNTDFERALADVGGPASGSSGIDEWRHPLLPLHGLDSGGAKGR